MVGINHRPSRGVHEKGEFQKKRTFVSEDHWLAIGISHRLSPSQMCKRCRIVQGIWVRQFLTEVESVQSGMSRKCNDGVTTYVVEVPSGPLLSCMHGIVNQRIYQSRDIDRWKGELCGGIT